MWISLYMFTVFCPARRYLVTLFFAVSFQGFFSFSKCACVTKTEKTSGEAKKGTCAVDCGLNFVFFFSILALLPFLTSLNDTPATIVTLRFVYPLYSTVALFSKRSTNFHIDNLLFKLIINPSILQFEQRKSCPWGCFVDINLILISIDLYRILLHHFLFSFSLCLAGMAQWWQSSCPTNVARVRFRPVAICGLNDMLVLALLWGFFSWAGLLKARFS